MFIGRRSANATVTRYKHYERFFRLWRIICQRKITIFLLKRKPGRLLRMSCLDAIDYFVLELEPVDIVYKESPILNSVSKFGSNLFFLILGIIIPSVIKEKVNQNGVQAYAIIIAALIIIGFIICMIKVYAYIDRKDTYLDKTRKLVIELKQIDLLNKLN